MSLLNRWKSYHHMYMRFLYQSDHAWKICLMANRVGLKTVRAKLTKSYTVILDFSPSASAEKWHARSLLTDDTRVKTQKILLKGSILVAALVSLSYMKQRGSNSYISQHSRKCILLESNTQQPKYSTKKWNFRDRAEFISKSLI